jgi:hypothetical protein
LAAPPSSTLLILVERLVILPTICKYLVSKEKRALAVVTQLKKSVALVAARITAPVAKNRNVTWYDLHIIN